MMVASTMTLPVDTARVMSDGSTYGRMCANPVLYAFSSNEVTVPANTVLNITAGTCIIPGEAGGSDGEGSASELAPAASTTVIDSAVAARNATNATNETAAHRQRVHFLYFGLLLSGLLTSEYGFPVNSCVNVKLCTSVIRYGRFTILPMRTVYSAAST